MSGSMYGIDGCTGAGEVGVHDGAVHRTVIVLAQHGRDLGENP